MNRAVSKFGSISLLAVLLFSVLCAFAQPEIEQKRIAAKEAYDAGGRYLEQNTSRSYQLALEQYRLSARLYDEIGDRGNYGSSMLGVGVMQENLGEYDAALASYLQALDLIREVGHNQLEARTMNNIGLLYERFGDLPKAIAYHELALPLRKLAGDRYGESNTLNSLGSVYLDLGERSKAIDLFNQALAIRIEIGNKKSQAITLSNLGRTYQELGEKAKALDYLERSLALRREVGDRDGEATTLGNIGMALDGPGEEKKAIEYFEQSLAILTDLGLENRKGTILSNIGVAYGELGDPAKALTYHRQALLIHRATSDKAGEATALNNIGYTSARLGNISAGFSDLNNALVLSRMVGSRRLEAIVLSNLMLVSKQANRPAAAVIFGKQCVGTYQELRRAVGGLDGSIQRSYLTSVAENYRLLADLLIELGRFVEAEEVLQILKQEEFSEFVRRDSTEIARLKATVKLTAKERSLIDRYTTLASRVTEIGEQFRKIDERKSQLSLREESLSPADEKQHALLAKQLADINAAFRLFLEKELINELGTDNAKIIETDRSLVNELKTWGTGTAALYTVITEKRYRVILTTPTMQIDAKTEISAEVLNKKIFAFRQALQNTGSSPLPLAKELYDILLKPIEKQLAAAGTKTLVWSLDGTLRYLPIAALSPDGKTYLVERYQNVTITPQTRQRIIGKASAWRALGMGISEEQMVSLPDQPDQKIKLDALPGTKQELISIVKDERIPTDAGIVSGRRFLDAEFTVGNFTDSLAAMDDSGGRKFTVIHLASHFRLGSNWSNSFLFLGNGKMLSLEEISSSQNVDFKDVELVTLSACNTALGTMTSGFEVDSLAEAVQAKSGKAVLATLWGVYDESTAILMSSFYREKTDDPRLSKAEALQRAQRKLLRDPSFAHPYYWSGFTLIGNWR